MFTTLARGYKTLERGPFSLTKDVAASFVHASMARDDDARGTSARPDCIVLMARRLS